MSNLLKCPKRETPLEFTKNKEISAIDIAGTLVVGSLVFGFLSLFLFSSHVLRGLVLLGGFVAFGLYYMVGYSKKEQLKCSQCGFKHTSETPNGAP
ncbi:hypothetical protein [Methylotenera sp.]|uniref:hypothetical protein n=1 Tax=Methylotenera sp. TaxID=2051956 RepID=UPI002ED88771